ncbi:choice-of-anchor M domain-containing protein [Catelliglobosispora koreensis]|uniref:choice-of-anchor M domain-containing protein n=1 Tax=Catelliglobosispora koreensis TaxID=129052 RepID=UPI00037DC2C3|nr:choice-of-anchor M domain-containing protein [Catelliglobosispora koreensis]
MRKLIPAAALVALIVLSATPAHAAVTLSSGHADAVDVNWSANTFSVKVLDDTVTPAVEGNPADVIFSVPSGAKTTVPSGAAYAFLGSPGDPVWVLPQSQKPGLLWLGWNTSGVPSGVLQSNNLQLKLTAVSGPDDFSLYTVGTFGAVTVLFDSGNGLPDSRTLNVAAHGHANWAFEAAGTYTLTFEVTGTRATDGATVSSGAVNYTFTVTS